MVLTCISDKGFPGKREAAILAGTTPIIFIFSSSRFSI
jgi:hypothetical protein